MRQPPTIRANAETTQRDPAARAAALIQTEKKESFRRRKRSRQLAMVVPTLIVIGATLWVLATIFRW